MLARNQFVKQRQQGVGLSKQPPNRWQDVIVIVGLGLVVLAGFAIAEWRQTGGQPGAPLDDVYIHFQFARNLATGHGLAFNPDQPTPGSTSPLWVLLLAGFYWLSDMLFLPTRLVSAVAFLLTSVATYALAWRLLNDRGAALLTGILTALSGRLAWTGLSGMETALFALVSILGILRRDVERRGNLPAFGSAVLFGLASVLRPEGYLLFAFALFDQWLELWRQRGKVEPWPWRLAMEGLSVGVYLAFVTPYLIFSYSATGHWLPNTFQVVGGSAGFTPLRYGREYLALILRDHPLLILFLPVGLIGLALRRRGPWLLVLLWTVGLPLVSVWIAPNLRHHGRYTMSLIPLHVLIGVAGLAALSAWWQKRTRGRTLVRRGWVGLAVLTIAVAVPVAIWWADQFAWNVNNINDMQVALGHWVAEHTSPDAILALNDIGAIGYLSQRRVVDVVGLVSPEAIDALRGKAPGWEQDVALCRFLSNRRPDYAILFPKWYPELTRNRQVLTPVHAVRLVRNTISGGEEMVVYQPRWPYVTAPSIAHSLEADLGGLVRLRGFDLSPAGETAPGSEVRLTLYWESLATMETDYKVFVHLSDEAEQIRGQHDAHPVDALAPTSFWQPGDVVRDEHIFVVAPDTSPGEYRLLAGLYDEATMARLPVERGPDAGSDRVLLMRLRVSQ